MASPDPLQPVGLLRQVVLPLTLAYVWFLWMILVVLRRGRSRSSAGRGGAVTRLPTWRKLAANLVGTTGLGYLLFLVMVGAHCVGFSDGRGCLHSALSGGAFLAFAVGLPTFLVAGWLEGPGGRRLRRHLGSLAAGTRRRLRAGPRGRLGGRPAATKARESLEEEAWIPRRRSTAPPSPGRG